MNTVYRFTRQQHTVALVIHYNTHLHVSNIHSKHGDHPASLIYDTNIKICDKSWYENQMTVSLLLRLSNINRMERKNFPVSTKLRYYH